MRRSLGCVMTVGAWLAAAPSQAQTFDPSFPVCMHVYSGASGGGGDWYDCSFTSLPQCRATAAGQAASCDPNPYYVASATRRLRHGQNR
ncbi:DUF3551 domain-containing protein [Bradyrhizobium sp. INPA01-394B]|uniref:DUF3551 domain-containing protein n=1 Tax=Bradyrhizobium campsiandrae TaxID=1729892 RepID=A0ABR7U8I3_9BRAD|nr:DUF3551 domain-containing protein [Bradyrhizobium campsiandrae]MBC9878424.1 DUF3551 domain-containing protein [Bradyrhizobium campsiandrae]MBC9980348.1 DUF3551 domain-containing protein [Bradyrhizobium campsiandrae]